MKPSGLEVRMMTWDADALRELGVPAVVSGGPGHAVAVRFTGDAFVVDDPRSPRPHTYDSPPEGIAGPAVVVVARDRSVASR